MTRPSLHVLAVASLALCVLFSGSACGGGGGGSNGGSSSTDGNNPPSGGINLASLRIVGTASGSSAAHSLDNLIVGDKLNVRALAIYTKSGIPSYSGAAYQSDVTNVVLTIDPSVATLSGTTLMAKGAGTGTISLTTNGETLTATVTVSTGLATISGRVRGVDDGVDEPGVGTVPVIFTDSGGNVVVRGSTGPDGRFVAHVPTSVTAFYADLSGFSNSYYDLFEFDSNTYSYNGGSADRCGVHLTVTSTTNATLDDAITTTKSASSGPPPPPVSGCGGTTS